MLWGNTFVTDFSTAIALDPVKLLIELFRGDGIWMLFKGVLYVFGPSSCLIFRHAALLPLLLPLAFV